MSIDQASTVLVGRLTDTPQRREIGDSDRSLVEFRLACNNGYRDRNGTWQVGESTFVTVQCWERLGDNVLATMRKGMPAIVVGRLTLSTWKQTDGDREETRSVMRVRALAVGPDLNTRTGTIHKDAQSVRREEERTGARGHAELTEDNAATAKTGVAAGNATGTAAAKARRGQEVGDVVGLPGADAMATPFGIEDEGQLEREPALANGR